MQDILVRELGGVSIEYTARVSESPWAVVHFTVRLPEGSRPGDVDTSLDNETRIQNLLTEAARTWGDRLIGAVKSGSISQAAAEHYSAAFPDVYKQAFDPLRRHRRHRDHRRAAGQFGQAGVLRGRRGPDLPAHLVPGWTIGVSERIAADAAVDGRGGARGAAVHRDPARRPAGVDLPVQDLRAAGRFATSTTSPSAMPPPPASPTPSPRSGRAASRSTDSTSWCCGPG